MSDHSPSGRDQGPHGQAEEPEEDPRKIATGSTLADISIRNHVFAWVLMFALIGFGTICYTGFGNVFPGMGISQNPDVDFPIINVSVTYEGAAPDIIETDVVDLIEDAVTTVEGVKQISSTSRQGSGNITIEFDLGRDIDAALQDVQTKIAQLAGRLPRGIDPPVVSKTNPEDQPIVRISVSGNRPPTFLADYIRNVIRPALQTVPGVGEMQLSGFRDRSVRVWYDAGKLESQGLTVLDVNKAIAREHLEVPAGRIETPEREMNVRAEGEAIDVDSFRSLVVAYREKTPIRLRDVAVVEDGLEDRRRIGRSMGEPVHRPRHHQAARRQRRPGGPGREGQAGAAQDPAPRGLEPRHQLGHHGLRGAGHRRDPVHPAPGLAAHGPRLPALPRLLVHHPERAPRHPHLDPRHLHRDVRLRLHPQHLHRARPHPGGGHRGGRRDHGAREHLPAPRGRHGQGARRPRWGRARSPSPPPPPPSPSWPSSCPWPS